jgi:hypothetical protein
MSWSLTTDATHGATHDALIAELENIDDEDRPSADAAIAAVRLLLSRVGDASYDPAVLVEVTGDGDRSILIEVSRVEGDVKEPHPNDAGGGANPPVVELTEAQERAEDVDAEIEHEIEHAQTEPDEEVIVVEPDPDDAQLSGEVYDPGDYKASEITDDGLDTYSTFELEEIRQREESGKARKSVLDQIANAIQRKGS